MGNRVVKIAKPRVSGSIKTQDYWDYTYYVRDAQGNVMATYTRTFTDDHSGHVTDKLKLGEADIYGSERVGLLDRSGENVNSHVVYNYSGFTGTYNEYFNTSTGTTTPLTALNNTTPFRELGHKAYELVNHLGNVLVTVSDRKLLKQQGSSSTIDYYYADVRSTADYAAFGAPMPGRTYVSDNYRYTFNGKEADDETSTQDYGMRIYNPALGRFLSVDPITKDYPELTPYQFASNRPIVSVDFDGLEGPPFGIELEWLTDVDGISIAIPKPCPFPIPMPPIAPPGYGISVPRMGDGNSIWVPNDIQITQGVIETPDFQITYYDAQTYNALKGYGRYQIGEYDDPSYSGAYKTPKANKSKTKDDVPDWAKGHRPRMDNGKGKPESGKDFAKRLMDKKYGEGKWSDMGPGSEYNQIKKWGDTDFKDVIIVPVRQFSIEEKKYQKFKADLKEYYKKQEQWKKDHPNKSAEA